MDQMNYFDGAVKVHKMDGIEIMQVVEDALDVAEDPIYMEMTSATPVETLMFEPTLSNAMEETWPNHDEVPTEEIENMIRINEQIEIPSSPVSEPVFKHTVPCSPVSEPVFKHTVPCEYLAFPESIMKKTALLKKAENVSSKAHVEPVFESKSAQILLQKKDEKWEQLKQAKAIVKEQREIIKQNEEIIRKQMIEKKRNAKKLAKLTLRVKKLQKLGVLKRRGRQLGSVSQYLKTIGIGSEELSDVDTPDSSSETEEELDVEDIKSDSDDEDEDDDGQPCLPKQAVTRSGRTRKTKSDLTDFVIPTKVANYVLTGNCDPSNVEKSPEPVLEKPKSKRGRKKGWHLVAKAAEASKNDNEDGSPKQIKKPIKRPRHVFSYKSRRRRHKTKLPDLKNYGTKISFEEPGSSIKVAQVEISLLDRVAAEKLIMSNETVSRDLGECSATKEIIIENPGEPTKKKRGRKSKSKADTEEVENKPEANQLKAKLDRKSIVVPLEEQLSVLRTVWDNFIETDKIVVNEVKSRNRLSKINKECNELQSLPVGEVVEPRVDTENAKTIDATESDTAKVFDENLDDHNPGDLVIDCPETTENDNALLSAQIDNKKIIRRKKAFRFGRKKKVISGVVVEKQKRKSKTLDIPKILMVYDEIESRGELNIKKEKGKRKSKASEPLHSIDAQEGEKSVETKSENSQIDVQNEAITLPPPELKKKRKYVRKSMVAAIAEEVNGVKRRSTGKKNNMAAQNLVNGETKRKLKDLAPECGNKDELEIFTLDIPNGIKKKKGLMSKQTVTKEMKPFEEVINGEDDSDEKAIKPKRKYSKTVKANESGVDDTSELQVQLNLDNSLLGPNEQNDLKTKKKGGRPRSKKSLAKLSEEQMNRTPTVESKLLISDSETPVHNEMINGVNDTSKLQVQLNLDQSEQNDLKTKKKLGRPRSKSILAKLSEDQMNSSTPTVESNLLLPDSETPLNNDDNEMISSTGDTSEFQVQLNLDNSLLDPNERNDLKTKKKGGRPRSKKSFAKLSEEQMNRTPSVESKLLISDSETPVHNEMINGVNDTSKLQVQLKLEMNPSAQVVMKPKRRYSKKIKISGAINGASELQVQLNLENSMLNPNEDKDLKTEKKKRRPRSKKSLTEHNEDQLNGTPTVESKLLLSDSETPVHNENSSVLGSPVRRSFREVKFTQKLVAFMQEEKSSLDTFENFVKRGMSSPVKAEESNQLLDEKLNEEVHKLADEMVKKCEWEPGSVVFAKSEEGGNYWPSLVVPDPYLDDLFAQTRYLNEKLSVFIHVQFLRIPGSHAWVPEHFLKPFPDSKEDCIPASIDEKEVKRLKAALDEGERLLYKTCKQRLSIMRKRTPLDRFAVPDVSLQNEASVCTPNARHRRLSPGGSLEKSSTAPTDGTPDTSLASTSVKKTVAKKRISKVKVEVEVKEIKPVPEGDKVESGTVNEEAKNKNDSEKKCKVPSSKRKLQDETLPPAKRVKKTPLLQNVVRAGSVDSDASGASSCSSINLMKLNLNEKRAKKHIFKDVGFGKLCEICSTGEGTPVQCSVCFDHFHPSCVQSAEPNLPPADEKTAWQCHWCRQRKNPCFVCNLSTGVRQRCLTANCGKFYHNACLKLFPQTKFNRGARKNIGLQVEEEDSTEDPPPEILRCSLHACHTCASDKPGDADFVVSDKLVQCTACPTAYHSGNGCMPAGCEVLSTTRIFCGKHYVKTHKFKTSWCFICCKGGSLITCDQCPSSIHPDCLNMKTVPDGDYACDECESGRFPLYGEVVWAKMPTYRWWPALIVYPQEIPLNLVGKSPRKCEFVVRFYGSHNYQWVNRERTFVYQDGDGELTRVKDEKKGLTKCFLKAIEEANEAFQQRKEALSLREHTKVSSASRPPSYTFIKRNKIIAKMQEVDISVCSCKPDSEEPCGPDSGCLNRLLNVECNPNQCPTGAKCMNQLFHKSSFDSRRLKPMRTKNRGWGLITKQPLKPGDFVIEYVGEVIDEEEFKTRLKIKQDNKEENYYYLSVDHNRIIDAGEKGNLSRFINHSCAPNCETQRWIVDGVERIGLFAIESIPAMTELTFNYNLQCDEKSECLCMAPTCQGFIGSKPPKVVKTNENRRKLSLSKKGRRSKNGLRIRGSQVADKQTECLKCGQGGDLVPCDDPACSSVCHLRCVGLESLPECGWYCHRHNCSKCNKPTRQCCIICGTAFCALHISRNLYSDQTTGSLLCSEHWVTKTNSQPRSCAYLKRHREEDPINEGNEALVGELVKEDLVQEEVMVSNEVGEASESPEYSDIEAEDDEEDLVPATDFDPSTQYLDQDGQVIEIEITSPSSEKKKKRTNLPRSSIFNDTSSADASDGGE